jgi:hypothetical protein
MDKKEIYMFNIIAEAKALALVQMTKKYYPEDQVRQFVTEMVERGFKREGIK